MVLVERWSPITHTFYLPMGDIGVPLIDFYMMTPLPMEEKPPPYVMNPSPELIHKCLGSQPVVYERGFKRVLLSWFKESYMWAKDESFKDEVDFMIRAFLFMLPG